MPPVARRNPRISKHRERARVWLGRWVDLGRYGDPDNRTRLQEAVDEWRLAGCPTIWESGGTVLDVATDYLEWVKVAKSRGSLLRETLALKDFCRLFGDRQAETVRPALIDDWRMDMVRQGMCRSTINERTWIVKAMIRRAVNRDDLEPEVWYRLSTVRGLRRGELGAVELPRVQQVARSIVDITLAHLPPVVAAMVQVQLATGMRPGEVCLLTPSAIDRTGPIWLYSPAQHKTANHGHSRTIAIGPIAQAVMRPWLDRKGERDSGGRAVFRPTDARPIHADRLNLKGQPNRTRDERRRARRARGFTGDRDPGDQYSTASYRRAIERACEDAGVARWHPNQLRHTRATEIRASSGLDAAAAVLGHSRVETTQVYAELATARAVEVAAASG